MCQCRSIRLGYKLDVVKPSASLASFISDDPTVLVIGCGRYGDNKLDGSFRRVFTLDYAFQFGEDVDVNILGILLKGISIIWNKPSGTSSTYDSLSRAKLKIWLAVFKKRAAKPLRKKVFDLAVIVKLSTNELLDDVNASLRLACFMVGRIESSRVWTTIILLCGRPEFGFSSWGVVDTRWDIFIIIYGSHKYRKHNVIDIKYLRIE